MINTGIGGSFQTGQGEQFATPKAFKNKKTITIRKVLKELVQQEIKNFKNI